jgi:hypothetical protein
VDATLPDANDPRSIMMGLPTFRRRVERRARDVAGIFTDRGLIKRHVQPHQWRDGLFLVKRRTKTHKDTDNFLVTVVL